MKRKAPPSPAEVLRLRLELQYVEPLIWREVDVISSTRLDELHYVIQAVMGWEDDHLWAFQAGERRFGPIGYGGFPEPSFRSAKAKGAHETSTTLVLVPSPRPRIRYAECSLNASCHGYLSNHWPRCV